MWATFNEPSVYGYAFGTHAPGIKDPLGAPFKASHTVIRAHAKAYHTYVTEFKDKQKGL